MITGIVKSDEGRIQLKIKGLRGREQEVDAVIDTGYTEWLTLPPSLVAALGLRWHPGRWQRKCQFDVCVAKVLWDGKVRPSQHVSGRRG